MIDQAAALRSMFRRPISTPVRAPAKGCRSIAVSSGKGGVGKTSLVVNLAVVLAGLGARVVMVDADLGLANIDVMLGLRPQHTLADVVGGHRRLQDVLVEGPLGVTLLPGASGLADLADLGPEQRARLIGSLHCLEEMADVLLIDTGAGIGAAVRSFAAAADELLVVTTPEPTAVADAYALIKVTHAQAQQVRFKLVINEVSSPREAHEAARKVVCVAREFLTVEVENWGYLPCDSAVSRAIVKQAPVVLVYPRSPVSMALIALGRKLWNEEATTSERKGGGGWVYRLKELIT